MNTALLIKDQSVRGFERFTHYKLCSEHSILQIFYNSSNLKFIYFVSMAVIIRLSYTVQNKTHTSILYSVQSIMDIAVE